MSNPNNHYYGEHAYNSQQLPKQDAGSLYAPSRSFWRPLNTSQGEIPQKLFFQMPPKEMRRLEHKPMPDWFNNDRYGAVNHRCLKPASLASSTNIFLMMEQIGWFAMIFFGVISVFTVIVMPFALGLDKLLQIILTLIAFLAIPAIIFAIGRVCREIYPLGHGIGSPWELNRQTGMVSIYTYDEAEPDKEPTVQSVPFTEMCAYIVNSADRYGFKHLLTLHHQSSPFTVQVGELIGDTSVIEGSDDLWDFIQDYMDTSKPLPDIPLFEEYRSQDPVTAEYDKKTGRNPRFWIDMDNSLWKQYKDLYLTPRDTRIKKRQQLNASVQHGISKV